MRTRIVFPRSDAVPRWQKIVAAAVAIAVGAGIFVIARRSAMQFAATAVLSFDPDAAGRNDAAVRHAGQPAIAVAQSMLSEPVVLQLLSRAGASPSDPAVGIGEFRSRLELDEPAVRTLRVLYHDPDGRRSRAVANAVAVAIAGWTPSSAAPAASAPLEAESAAGPSSATPAAAAGPRRRHARRAAENLSNLAEELAVTEQKIGDLSNAETSPVRPAPSTQPPSAQTDQRRTLEAQLAAARQKLEALRVRYTDEYPDVEMTKDTIAEIQNEMAALPPPAKPSILETKSPAPAAHAAEIERLRQKRAELTKEIAIEKHRLTTSRDDSDNGEAAAAASSSAPRTTSASPAAAAVEQPISAFSSAGTWQNPFRIVRLTRSSSVSFAWPAVVAGTVGALVYAGLILILFFLRGGVANIDATRLAAVAAAPIPAWAPRAEESDFDEPPPAEPGGSIKEPVVPRIDPRPGEEPAFEPEAESYAEREEENLAGDFVETPTAAAEASTAEPEVETRAESEQEAVAAGFVETPAAVASTAEPRVETHAEVEEEAIAADFVETPAAAASTAEPEVETHADGEQEAVAADHVEMSAASAEAFTAEPEVETRAESEQEAVAADFVETPAAAAEAFTAEPEVETRAKSEQEAVAADFVETPATAAEDFTVEPEVETPAGGKEEAVANEFIETPGPTAEEPSAQPEATTAAELYEELLAKGLFELPPPARQAVTGEPEAISPPEAKASEVAASYPNPEPRPEVAEESKSVVRQPDEAHGSFANSGPPDPEWAARLLRAISTTSLGELHGEAGLRNVKSMAVDSKASAAAPGPAELRDADASPRREADTSEEQHKSATRTRRYGS